MQSRWFAFKCPSYPPQPPSLQQADDTQLFPFYCWERGVEQARRLAQVFLTWRQALFFAITSWVGIHDYEEVLISVDGASLISPLSEGRHSAGSAHWHSEQAECSFCLSELSFKPGEVVQVPTFITAKQTTNRCSLVPAIMCSVSSTRH